MSNTLLRQLSWLLVTLPSLILFDGLSVLAFCLHTDSHSRAENHSHKATVHQQTLTDPEFVNVCCEVMLNFYFILFLLHLCAQPHTYICAKEDIAIVTQGGFQKVFQFDAQNRMSPQFYK